MNQKLFWIGIIILLVVGIMGTLFWIGYLLGQHSVSQKALDMIAAQNCIRINP